MRTKFFFGAVIVTVMAVMVAVVIRAEKRARMARIAAEVKTVVTAQYHTSQIDGGKPSEELLAMAKESPDFIMAFFVMAEAEHFPGMQDGFEQEVLTTARELGTVAALAKVRKAVDEGLNKAIVDSSKKPEDGRIGWINNNPATAMIFLEWPIAEKLGKKTEYVTSHLVGTYRDEPNWHAPITNQQMIDWWWGKWPFPGEKSPLE